MNFQYILLSVFALAAVVSVIVFANPPEGGSGDSSLVGAQGEVVIWGTYPEDRVMMGLTKFTQKYQDSFKLTYQYHDPATFDVNIVEALASGRGPDILLLPNDLILRHMDKIEEIPYSWIPQLTFQNSFVQSAEIYMRNQGLTAVPYVIDPIIMYWNRDLFNNESLTTPPKYWDELLVMGTKLTKRDGRTQDILQSAIPFGEYDNVAHAKDVIAMLFLQTGSSIIEERDGYFTSTLENKEGERFTPNESVVSALRFFMDFSDPRKTNYSWSRALPNSRDLFLRGDLAIHFDYVSAYDSIKLSNPHLNFGIAMVPQVRNTSVEVTFARLHGLAVLKSSKNKSTAFIALTKLLEPEYVTNFSSEFNLPPVRRDILGVPQTNALNAVSYDSAIRARTWLDPRPDQTSRAFAEMVESISSGRSNAQDAISVLSGKIQASLLR